MDASGSTGFRRFAEERLTSLVRFGVALTGNRDTGEDLVQAALVRTVAGWHRLRDPERVEAYVRRAMVNLHINAGRSRGREQPLDDHYDIADPGPAPDLDVRDTLARALATLPRRQRAVLVLRYYADMSEREIAVVLGCSPGTVKSQAARALAKLRMATGLRDGDGGDGGGDGGGGGNSDDGSGGDPDAHPIAATEAV